MPAAWRTIGEHHPRPGRKDQPHQSGDHTHTARQSALWGTAPLATLPEDGRMTASLGDGRALLSSPTTRLISIVGGDVQ
jgi:hypothetical protein